MHPGQSRGFGAGVHVAAASHVSVEERGYPRENGGAELAGRAQDKHGIVLDDRWERGGTRLFAHASSGCGSISGGAQ